MAAEKTLAIVVKVVEFSESSCIVTMLTREFGKITALAKVHVGGKVLVRALLTCCQSVE